MPDKIAECILARTRRTKSCRVWLGARTTSGYGCIFHMGRTRTVHRVLWESLYGRIEQNLCVCHTCDTRLCLEISHLFLGTNADNVHDRVTKQRSATGSRNGRYTKPQQTARGTKSATSKLTEDKVRLIRQLFIPGNGPKIANKFGVTPTTIYTVVKRKSWKHVI